MAPVTIPVDLRNPGQVFACLGFMEAAEILCGACEGYFQWKNGVEAFSIAAKGTENPIRSVLEFLASARIAVGDRPDWGRKEKQKNQDQNKKTIDAVFGDETGDEVDLGHGGKEPLINVPAALADTMALPLILGGGNMPQIIISHWADGSSRNSFKLYAGNRTGVGIAQAMLRGTFDKKGRQKSNGISQLFQNRGPELIAKPFDVLTPMGGSFNFDPRGAWTAIDVGYSPNQHKHSVEASPVVELLAAIGLENTRPDEFELRKARYAVWCESVPLILARAVITDALPLLSDRRFRFDLALSGKNKVVTFAQEEFFQ
jgi:CRISPR-associated protein Csx14